MKTMSTIPDSPIKERKCSEGSDIENDPQFKPIVQLPEIEVSTNEENENVLLKLRAKLYRFDSSSEPSEWKERGTGEMKILQHKENFSARIVMRRDKTLKVCANHFITPWMGLQASWGSEKAFVYKAAADFADEEPKSECLAIKFATIENANSFKNKFEEVKVSLVKNCPLYNGEADDESDEECDKENDANEITEKLSDLSVKKKIENEK